MSADALFLSLPSGALLRLAVNPGGHLYASLCEHEAEPLRIACQAGARLLCASLVTCISSGRCLALAALLEPREGGSSLRVCSFAAHGSSVQCTELACLALRSTEADGAALLDGPLLVCRLPTEKALFVAAPRNCTQRDCTHLVATRASTASAGWRSAILRFAAPPELLLACWLSDLPAALLRLPDASQRAAFALVSLLEAFADARGESDDARLARYILSAEATAPSHLAAGTRCACLLRGDPATLALWRVDAATQSHLLTLLRGGATLSSAALPLASDAAPACMEPPRARRQQ